MMPLEDIAIIASYDYWPYGVVRVQTGSAGHNPFQFVGAFQYYQHAASAADVRKRVLRVDLGRWQTEDPIGFAGGDFNLYGYVGNDPVLLVDPQGLMWSQAQCRLEFRCKNTADCVICLQTEVKGKWVDDVCWKAGSGFEDGTGRIPSGCWCFASSSWVDQFQNTGNPAWGNGRVCMPLKPCKDDESRLRRENPGRGFHPGSFCLHGGAEPGWGGDYWGPGCITATSPDIEKIKKKLKKCANRSSSCFEVRVR